MHDQALESPIYAYLKPVLQNRIGTSRGHAASCRQAPCVASQPPPVDVEHHPDAQDGGAQVPEEREHRHAQQARLH